MTIKNIIDASLRLLNQYSIAGATVPLTYNDQQDDILRMIDLINDAQMEIAITTKPITEFIKYRVQPRKPDDPIKMLELTMPSDFHSVEAIYFTPDSDRVERTVDASMYKWLGDTTLAVPNAVPGSYRIVYNRYPIQYAQDVDTSTELDNSPDTHAAIPYFVAAMVALSDNPKAYYAMYNIWETRLSRLGAKKAHAVSTQVTDVYGFDNFRGL